MNRISNTRIIKSVIILTVCLLLPSCQGTRPKERQEDRPNIIIVMVDDVSAREFSCYGGEGIHTPSIDLMAREGIMFRTAWSQPLCGPTRAAGSIRVPRASPPVQRRCHHASDRANQRASMIAPTGGGFP